jgi:hypothetical protein
LHDGRVISLELRSAHLTAPNNAPSHSFLSVSTVLSGSAVPVFLNVSKPASRSTKLNFTCNEAGRASRIRRPAGMTSRPMPSPAMRPKDWLVVRRSIVQLAEPKRNVLAAAIVNVAAMQLST